MGKIGCYTVDWFSGNSELWATFLHPFRQRATNYLELGVFQGRSIEWMLRYILVHPESKAVGIDHWHKNISNKPGTGEHIEKTARHNLRWWPTKARLIKGVLPDALKHVADQRFDIVYVDDCHHPDHCYSECKIVWGLVNPGGVVIFDNYQAILGGNTKHSSCKAGVDRFLSEIGPDAFECIAEGHQKLIRKMK